MGRVGRLAAALLFLALATACATPSSGYRLRKGESYRRPKGVTVGGGGSQTEANWPAYLFGADHTSAARGDTSITPANAGTLLRAWRFTPDAPSRQGQPPRQLTASPTVYAGRIYIGANTGDFYAIDDTSGSVVWKRFLGFTAGTTCGARGFTSTATVAKDPSTGDPTIYVAAADGFLYALSPEDGSTVWKGQVVVPGKDQNAGYNWGSPTVAGGHVFMGISSHCDNPLIRGGVKEFDQATGTLQHTYYVVPAGHVGGSVWSSLAATRGAASVFVSTGNADPKGGPAGDSYSIVRLDGDSLARRDIWTVPGLEKTDQDFGASPTLFSASVGGGKEPMVAVCNKNGHLYAFAQGALSQGPAWDVQLSLEWPDGNCLGAAVWDQTRSQLIVAAAQTSIARKPTRGSVRALDPATGKPKWQVPLPAVVWGTPSLGGGGVVAVATFDFDASARNAAYLLGAKDGKILATLDLRGDKAFAQPVFADGMLLVATLADGLIAFRPS
jgi:outer membrane protein assembly factor BamB